MPASCTRKFKPLITKAGQIWPSLRGEKVTPNETLQTWAEVLIKTSGEIGYSHNTPLARMMEHSERCGEFGPSLPPGVKIRGLSQFNIVERVLRQYSPEYRQSALAAYALPSSIVGKTNQEQANFLGIPLDTHKRRLTRLRKYIERGKTLSNW